MPRPWPKDTRGQLTGDVPVGGTETVPPTDNGRNGEGWTTISSYRFQTGTGRTDPGPARPQPFGGPKMEPPSIASRGSKTVPRRIRPLPVAEIFQAVPFRYCLKIMPRPSRRSVLLKTRQSEIGQCHQAKKAALSAMWIKAPPGTNMGQLLFSFRFRRHGAASGSAGQATQQRCPSARVSNAARGRGVDAGCSSARPERSS